jgi:uncharacterized membrane protein YfcA
MLTGAIAGALIVLQASTGWALGAVTALLAAVAVAAQFGQTPRHEPPRPAGAE